MAPGRALGENPLAVPSEMSPIPDPFRPLVSAALWLVGAVALVVLAFAASLGPLAVVVYSAVGLVVAARVMTWFWLAPVDCTREIDRDVVEVGDTVSVAVRIRNASFWPILWLYVEESLPPKTPKDGTWKRFLFLPPGRSFHLNYRIIPSRRGLHRIGPIVVESGDVFGLFKKSRVERRRDFVTALPRYTVIEEFEIGRRRNLGDLGAERSLFDDPSRIRGLREYRRGDSLKRIHWKTSARRGELYSKIYDPVTEAGATLILDFHRDGWREARAHDPAKVPHEAAIEVVCTIARYLADGGWKVGFFTNGRDPLGIPGIAMAEARATETLSGALEAARLGIPDDRLAPVSIPARPGLEHFELIRENLGRVELTDGLPIGDLLMEELPRIERQQVLVVVAGGADDHFVSAILRARALGYRVMVFLVCNNADHDKAFAAFAPRGIDLHRIDEDWRLKEIATGRRSF